MIDVLPALLAGVDDPVVRVDSGPGAAGARVVSCNGDMGADGVPVCCSAELFRSETSSSLDTRAGAASGPGGGVDVVAEDVWPWVCPSVDIKVDGIAFFGRCLDGGVEIEAACTSSIGEAMERGDLVGSDPCQSRMLGYHVFQW